MFEEKKYKIWYDGGSKVMMITLAGDIDEMLTVELKAKVNAVIDQFRLIDVWLQFSRECRLCDEAKLFLIDLYGRLNCRKVVIMGALDMVRNLSRFLKGFVVSRDVEFTAVVGQGYIRLEKDRARMSV